MIASPTVCRFSYSGKDKAKVIVGSSCNTLVDLTLESTPKKGWIFASTRPKSCGWESKVKQDTLTQQALRYVKKNAGSRFVKQQLFLGNGNDFEVGQPSMLIGEVNK